MFILYIVKDWKQSVILCSILKVITYFYLQHGLTVTLLDLDVSYITWLLLQTHSFSERLLNYFKHECEQPRAPARSSSAILNASIWAQLWLSGLEKDPSCLVLMSFSCSSCLCPRRYKYSMCITSVLLMRAFTLNSSRIRGTKPGLSFPACKNWRYRARTCFCSLLCLAITRSTDWSRTSSWVWLGLNSNWGTLNAPPGHRPLNAPQASGSASSGGLVMLGQAVLFLNTSWFSKNTQTCWSWKDIKSLTEKWKPVQEIWTLMDELK